jgi:phasin family protein
MTMSMNFDPNAAFDAYRNTFAPVLRAQQEGLKAFDRLAHFQYALAGDYLEWSLAQAKSILAAKSPTELFAKQTELGAKFSDQLRGRVQEFSSLANETQATMTQLIDQATAKFVDVAKKAA